MEELSGWKKGNYILAGLNVFAGDVKKQRTGEESVGYRSENDRGSDCFWYNESL